MLPKLAGGLSSLNIPPLDPFEVERTPFTYRRGNNIDISGSVRKVKIYGGSQMIIEDVKWVFFCRIAVELIRIKNMKYYWTEPTSRKLEWLLISLFACRTHRPKDSTEAKDVSTLWKSVPRDTLMSLLVIEDWKWPLVQWNQRSFNFFTVRRWRHD